MATLGTTTKVEFSADGTTFVEADGIDTAEFGHEIDLLDVNVFKDSTTFKKRLANMTDHTASFSGLYVVDATAQGLLRSRALSGSRIWWKIKYDGTNGYGVTVAGAGDFIKSFRVSTDVNGIVKFSAEIVGGAALEDVGTPD